MITGIDGIELTQGMKIVVPQRKSSYCWLNLYMLLETPRIVNGKAVCKARPLDPKTRLASGAKEVTLSSGLADCIVI